jgi:hypothetical protein
MNMKKISIFLIAFFAFACKQLQAQVVLNIDSVHNISSCNSGQIFCSSSGGVGLIQFTLNGGVSNYTGIFSQLSAGTYTVIATDSLANDADTAVATISGAGTPITIALTNIISSTCITGCDSTIINASGGTPPYVYSSNSAGVNFSGNIARICNTTASTIYTFVVVDANGCQGSATKLVQATNSTQMSFSNIPTQPTCSNSNGKIVASVSGGIAPYTYTLNGVAASSPMLNLAAGTYTVVATSNSGCTKSIVHTLNNSLTLFTTFTKVNPICTQLNGSATVSTVNGSGTAPYSYLWNNGATTPTISGLAAGTYTCTVTDNLGCSKSNTVVLTIASPIGLIVTKTNTICNSSIGKIKIFPANGIGPFTFLWNNGATSDSLVGLAAGNYTCTVTDNVGCTASSTNTIVPINNLNISTTATNSSCNASNGSLTASLGGGTGPFSYSINGGAASASNIFTNLQVGTYTCVVSDANGCTKSSSKTITSVNNMTLSLLSIQNTCNGNNGALKVTGSNGLAPYTYNWNTIPAQSTDSISGLANGIYNVTVTDANGCTRLDSFLIQTINMMAVTNSNSICSGDTTSINVSIQNSSLQLPQGYLASTATATADEDIVSFSIGSFTQTSSCTSNNGAVNANGFAPSVLNKYSNYTNISAGIFGIGTSVPYNLQFSACNNVGYSTNYSIFIDFNRNGIFDANEKVAGSTSSTVAAVAPLVTTISGNIAIPVNITPGATLLRVVLQEANASPAATGTYTWGETEDYKIVLGNVLTNQSMFYPSASVVSVNNNVAIVSPTATTTYTIVNTDPQICDDTTYATITVNNVLANNTITSMATDVDCPLSTNGQIAVVATPVSNSLVYNWSNGDSANIATNLSIGNYKVTVYDSTGACQVLMDTVESLGINCGNVGGVVKHDANDNCIAEASEAPIPNTMITANPGNHITYSDATGHYSFAGLPYATYTITHGNNLPSFVNNCAPSVSTVLDSLNFASLVDFADSNKKVYDYRIYSWNGCIAPALGQTKRKIYVHHNQPNLTASATAYVVFDSIQLYKSSVPTHSSINGDTVFWNLNITGNYYSSTNGGLIDLELDVDSATQMGVVYHLKTGIYSTQFADTVLGNNHHSYTITTCTSYDPNDKSVTPIGKTAYGYIPVAEAQKDYVVNFQNTGNFTAGRVIIMDTLSANLDITSFEVIGASHPYQMQVINNHILKFAFLNIMLPDSGTNLEGSKGHIAFTIKHNSNLVAGSTIVNKASIYFDFNAPVNTNYVMNTLYDPLVSNNSTSNNTMCNAICGNGSATIIDAGGVAPFTHSISPMCAATTVNGNQITNLASGNFVITTTDAIGNVVTNSSVVNNTPSTLQIASANVIQPAAGVWGSVAVNAANGAGNYTYLWTPGNMTTSTANNLTAGNYTCVVTDANGCKSSAVYTINIPLDVKGTVVNNFKVYPNPTSGNLTLENDAPLGKIQITNALGVVVKEIATQANIANIDVSTLANGMYEIRTQKGIVTKFVKQN